MTNLRFSPTAQCWILLAALIAPAMAQSDSWKSTAGAQSVTKDRQAFAFLPNELWIHAGDSVTWLIDSDEMHTVTFLKPGATRPTFQAGCPGSTPDGSLFGASACVNSGTMTSGQTYSVNFPSTGNFKLVCLVHPSMTGTIHVLDLQATLPHDQRFYDAAAASRRIQLLGLSSTILNSVRPQGEDTAASRVSQRSHRRPRRSSGDPGR